MLANGPYKHVQIRTILLSYITNVVKKKNVLYQTDRTQIAFLRCVNKIDLF